MKTITKEMIQRYDLKHTQYDFMGYTFTNRNYLSFHHLIIPHKDCQALGFGEGYFFGNGAILVQDTSHEYLHLIQRIDEPMFLYLTHLLIQENKLGLLDKSILKEIRAVLLEFEKQHKEDKRKKDNQLIIKSKYTTDRIDLDVEPAESIPLYSRSSLYEQIPRTYQTDAILQKLNKK